MKRVSSETDEDVYKYTSQRVLFLYTSLGFLFQEWMAERILSSDASGAVERHALAHEVDSLEQRVRVVVPCQVVLDILLCSTGAVRLSCRWWSRPVLFEDARV